MKVKIDKIITIHNRHAAVAKQSKGIMSKKNAMAIEKMKNRTVQTIAKHEKEIEKTLADFGKYLVARKDLVDDSECVLKAVAKSKFPNAYKKVWGKK